MEVSGRLFAERLVELERSRGSTRDIACRQVANKLRVGPGTVERLLRGRAKRLDARLFVNLTSLLSAELRAEVGRLLNELQNVQQRGYAVDKNEVAEVEACLEKASEILRDWGVDTQVVNNK